MSDIQEEQKRLYKRAEENDYIVKDIAQYEKNDSKLAKYTILELQNRINKAIEYINTHSEMTDIQIYGIENTLAFRGSLDKLLNILKGDNK